MKASHDADYDGNSGLEFRNPLGDKRADGGLDHLPLPPIDLRMGYGDDQQYLKRSEETSQAIAALIDQHCQANSSLRILDWGCASGRVIRGLTRFAQSGEVWGVDQSAACIAWNRVKLAPPFHFATCSCWPHLPFEDNHFDFIFGISVFTHIAELVDTWLLEMRRIMRPGAYALFTIHDEHSIDFFKERKKLPYWLAEGTDLDLLQQQEVVVVRGGNWSREYTIFRSDWIQYFWGQFFEVVEIIPRFEHSQTGVLIRKRLRED